MEITIVTDPLFPFVSLQLNSKIPNHYTLCFSGGRIRAWTALTWYGEGPGPLDIEHPRQKAHSGPPFQDPSQISGASFLLYFQ